MLTFDKLHSIGGWHDQQLKLTGSEALENTVLTELGSCLYLAVWRELKDTLHKEYFQTGSSVGSVHSPRLKGL